MQTHITGRGLALAAGILATGGALAILLQDAIRTNVWLLEHGLIPVLMGVQIFTSHSIGNALKSRRWGSAAGFFFVAAMATWGVLYTSVGKQTKTSAESTLAAQDVNGRRSKAQQKIAEADFMLATCPPATPEKHFGERCGLRDAMNAECKSGKGKRCEGRKYSVDTYEAAIAGYQKQLTEIGPEKPVGANADKMAELISVIFHTDKDGTKHILLLTEPFTYASIFELAALVSFGFAFSGRSTKVLVQPEAPAPSLEQRMAAFETAQPSGQITVRTVRADPDGRSGGPKLPAPKKPNGPAPDGRTETPAISQLKQIAITGRMDGATEGLEGRVLNFVRSELSAGRSIPSQASLLIRFKADGLARSTLSDWFGKWEAAGLIPERTQVGRCKVLAPAN